MKRSEFLKLVDSELVKAYSKHGTDKWGRHEFYGVIKEEFDEVWYCIKSDSDSNELIYELSQVVAMIFRYIETGNRYSEGL